MMRIRFLKGGEKIGIVAPGFAVKRQHVLRGAAYLKRKGFNVIFGKSIFRKSGYFAGSDEERACDLNAMIEDREVRAIVFARGGFGTSRILNRINFDALRKDPKILLGYSDLTSLFLTVRKIVDIPVFYGPVAVELRNLKCYDEKSLWALLLGKSFRIKIGKRQVLVEGRSEAVAEGGCLTLIANLLGTPFEPDFSGKILFWEEMGEEAYRIDRLLSHLSMARKLEKLRGVIVGRLVGCVESRLSPGKRSIKEILEEYFGNRGIPVLYNFPAGHCLKKVTIPLGIKMTIDTERYSVEFKTSCRESVR
ncbi:MAG: LD-carboxypeptidase [Acidobacteriota bacterium]